MANIISKVRDYEEVTAQIKALEEKQEAIRNELVVLMNGAEKIEIGGYKLSNKITIRETLDSKGIKDNEPELYSKYKKETIYARFGVKKIA